MDEVKWDAGELPENVKEQMIAEQNVKIAAQLRQQADAIDPQEHKEYLDILQRRMEEEERPQDLELTVAVHRDRVLLQFGIAVEHVALEPRQAHAVGRAIMKCARKIGRGHG